MLNQVVLVGRLVDNIEVVEIKNADKKVASITLAVPRPYKNSDGKYDTDFIPIKIWDSIAENTAEYCRKGDIIGVKGRIQCTHSDYDDLEFIAEKITFLSSKKTEDGE